MAERASSTENGFSSRLIVVVAALAILATALFPPFVEIDGRVSAHTNYQSVLYLRDIHWGTFIWPLTLIILFAEWLVIVLLAIVTNWLIKTLSALHRRHQ